MNNTPLKHFLISIPFILFAPYLIYPQTDSSAASFFPAAISDTWHYIYTPTAGFTTVLTHDSVANGERYLFYDHSSVPMIKIDSLDNVVYNPNQGVYEELRFKLRAQYHDSWVAQKWDGRQIAARIDDMGWGIVLGKITQIKKIGYYYQQNNDTTDFYFWRNDLYIAAGFGLWLEITDAMSTSAMELAGCIINGTRYGELTSVSANPRSQIPSTTQLFPAYPNPFNPSTTISYTLRKDCHVILKIYDVAGREIESLVDGYKEAGYHKAQFAPKDLSNGVYLIRLTAGDYMQSNKIIYSK